MIPVDFEQWKCANFHKGKKDKKVGCCCIAPLTHSFFLDFPLGLDLSYSFLHIAQAIPEPIQALSQMRQSPIRSRDGMSADAVDAVG